MMRKHEDEIWRLADRNIPDDGSSSTFAYESAWFIEFSGVEEWIAEFNEHIKPGLDQLVEEGLLTGWARLGHDTGGPYNSKVIYWIEEWDLVDDVLTRVGQMRQEAGLGAESARSIRAHSDQIWMNARASGM